ncbi:hypothetical protein M422DRAFT_253132 [Sphaerobolus stellatus SS14]|uniref:Uncharacterized protein n=1 Tax=Sphaerobolus stellatus (strain SS14) TaxID=990650 RepID=A0A0C9V994_SPHS4|nr:hypothetical protein M422DRAFT_253132 [Sphaerobolus stellatus SS14]
MFGREESGIAGAEVPNGTNRLSTANGGRVELSCRGPPPPPPDLVTDKSITGAYDDFRRWLQRGGRNFSTQCYYSVTCPATTRYTDQLAPRLKACPLWGSLHSSLPPVDIGDVGYVSLEHGGWVRLFNLHTDTDPGKLPPGTNPGCLKVTEEDMTGTVLTGPFMSTSVKGIAINASVTTGGSTAGISYECHSKRGAVLFVDNDGVQNIVTWYDFAHKRSIRMSDLVFVTGYGRTTSWVAALFTEKSQSCIFGLAATIPALNTNANIEICGSFKCLNIPAWTGGPEGMINSPYDSQFQANLFKHKDIPISSPGLLPPDDPQHQCVFVQGYRMEHRNLLDRILSPSKSIRAQGIQILAKKGTSSTIGVIPSPRTSIERNDAEEATAPGVPVTVDSNDITSSQPPPTDLEVAVSEGTLSQPPTSTESQDDGGESNRQKRRRHRFSYRGVDPSRRGGDPNRRGGGGVGVGGGGDGGGIGGHTEKGDGGGENDAVGSHSGRDGKGHTGAQHARNSDNTSIDYSLRGVILKT